jgi:hypothetical protein
MVKYILDERRHFPGYAIFLEQAAQRIAGTDAKPDQQSNGLSDEVLGRCQSRVYAQDDAKVLRISIP